MKDLEYRVITHCRDLASKIETLAAKSGDIGKPDTPGHQLWIAGSEIRLWLESLLKHRRWKED